MSRLTRRELLTATGLAGLWTLDPGPWTLDPRTLDPGPRTLDHQDASRRESLPAQDPALVQEVVGASHTNLARVTELVTRQPALAKAAWDWGFGDWETALGAASHVGQRDIARLLIDHGAPPTIFSAAMLGQLDVVKALIAAQPGLQRRRGPHGITLLSHAQAGGPESAAVVTYLKELGGADERPALTPLSADDRALIVGTYRFGSGERDVFVIDDVREQLGMARPGASRNRLFCVGVLPTGWTFYPAGAEAVRIRIERAGDRAASLTIADPEVFITAQRQ